MVEAENRADEKPEAEEDEIVFGLSDRFINGVVEALNGDDREKVLAELKDLSDADTAELISKISDSDRQLLLKEFSEKMDPYVFSELSSDLQRIVLPELPPQQVAAIISELDSDDALYMIQNLDEDFQHDIIHHLSAKTRMTLQEGLSFPEDSAGRLMQREFVAVPQFWTVGKTIDFLRAAADELPDDFFDLFVIDPGYHIVGEIPLNRLVRARRSEKVESLRLEDTHPIPATMDQEEVAQLFRRENLMSAPVVDEEDRLIGVITIDDVVDVIDQEAQDDILKLGGVKGDSDIYRNLRATTWSRFRWLFINLWTAILASAVVALFDATIEQIVALAVLMPIVASMGGNAGTQTLTVAVRALATREISDTNAMRIIIKETLVATLNGIGFAILMGLIAGVWFHSVPLGLVIGAAMVINLFCAGLFGAAIPIILDKIGSDPAVSSAIFLTTVTDVVGFFAFLGLASIFLV
ncbi:MAG: magnesium transporter [Micavibrio aeruginosavorus]|nr:magnesium transporter [Micavibrio aeruginosavorus]